MKYSVTVLVEMKVAVIVAVKVEENVTMIVDINIEVNDLPNIHRHMTSMIVPTGNACVVP